MLTVDVAEAAALDLESLISTHSLPQDTKTRVVHSISVLREFPKLGPELSRKGRRIRFLLGPWRWLIIVYEYIESQDRVIIISIQDARSARSATSKRS